MSDGLKKIRWRLLIGVVSFVLTIAVTMPAAGARVDLGKRVADLWPNAEAQLADIWPNADATFDSVLSDVIWPNAGLIGGTIGGTTDGQGSQDSQANQDNQANPDNQGS